MRMQKKTGFLGSESFSVLSLYKMSAVTIFRHTAKLSTNSENDVV